MSTEERIAELETRVARQRAQIEQLLARNRALEAESVPTTRHRPTTVTPPSSGGRLIPTPRTRGALRRVIASVYHALRRAQPFNSTAYWEQRYAEGDNSGAGSYGRLARYKAEFLNAFAKDNGITSVIEFGSGDGAQLGLFAFERYVGLYVSKTSIGLCIQRHASDKSKSFYLYDPACFLDHRRLFVSDLALSLDVIYHLVEDAVFEKYMHDLFAASDQYVIVYASNTERNARGQAQHVRHRKFTDWVEEHEQTWALVEHVKNPYSLQSNEHDESFADFYIFKKAG